MSDKVNIGVPIDKKLHRQLKLTAALSERQMKDIIIDGIRSEIKKYSDTTKTEGVKDDS